MPKVVCVDDEPHIRQVITLKLTGAGYHVEAAANAREGVELVERLLPDVTISDYRMPGEWNGVDLVYQIRARPATSEIPIILLTGSVAVLNQLQEELRDVPKITLLSKPFSPRQLLRQVEQVLMGNTAGGEA